MAAPTSPIIAASATAVIATMALTCNWGKCKRCTVLVVNDPQHALFLCLAGPIPFWARVLSFLLTIFQGRGCLFRVNNECTAGHDILSGGASVTEYSALKNARKVALASFNATAIQALIVTHYGLGTVLCCVIR